MAANDRIDEARWQSMERISQHVANTHPGRSSSSLTTEQRFDAALDALVQHVADRGWPDGQDFGDMFRAAANGVRTSMYEADKHVRHWAYWHEPPSPVDALAEAVTDRLATWEICWSLTPGEWASVWATAEAMRLGGGRALAASLTGKRVGAHTQLLITARAKARAAWIAAGETPRGHYHPYASGTGQRLGEWHQSRKRATRRELARDEQEGAA